MRQNLKIPMLCAVVLSVAAVLLADLSVEELFLTYSRANQTFSQANEQTDAAQSRRLYEQAIVDYESLIKQGGIYNAKLYYNLANACLLTDDLGRAILNYRRALELDGANPDIHKNLSFARAKQIDRIPVTAKKKVLERLFFWHYDFSMRTRFLIGGISFSVLCLYLTLRLWVVQVPRWRPFCVILGLLAAAMAASVVLETVHQSRYRCGVILASEVTARQGDGQNYPPSFNEPLHAGLEFELIEQRPDWLHIVLANGQQTWIPSNSAELI
jgi:tetratricopeptide (TPR) repeat protein